MQPRRPAKIYEVRNRNNVTTYRVDLGKDDSGKRVTYGFDSREEAEAFKKKCDESLVSDKSRPIPTNTAPTPIKEAKLYEVKNRSGSITYRVDFVGGDGKRVARGFEEKAKAEQFQKVINGKLASQKMAQAMDLAGVHRHEILAAVDKLEKAGATIAEAVDFFLKYGRPPAGDITVSDAVKEFLVDKAKMHRSAKYMHNCEKIYFRPFSEAFGQNKVNELLGAEIRDYLNDQNWSNNTRNAHRNYLSTLYCWLIKKGYSRRNPIEDVDLFPKTDPPIRVLSSDQVRQLLNYTFQNEIYDACAAMVLVFFCGVRVDEVDRTQWEDVNFELKNISLAGAITKKGKRRTNPISDNALMWLRNCYDLGKFKVGRIAPNDYQQRMRRIRRRAGLTAEDYLQNAMRHSFCSYHLERFKTAAETAWMLGHPNPVLLYNTYNGMVSATAAKEYWRIYPPTDDGADTEDRLEQADVADTEGLDHAR